MTILMLLAGFGLAFLVVDCFEVGRNDGANIVNSVFGARILKRRHAVLLAGVAVVLGATFGSAVMETARKGIFTPGAITGADANEILFKLMCIYISVYVVDTILLYGFSAYGLPVSTTACLVFELVGASLFIGGVDVVNWDKTSDVVTGIIVSILVAGVGAYLIQRMVRGAMREDPQNREQVLLHGPWIAGGMLTFLTWFLVFKGLKNIAAVAWLKDHTFGVYGEPTVLIFGWAVFTLAVHLFLVFAGAKGTRHLFNGMAVLGMVCMAFAFGQNDLANAASPGLSAWVLYKNAGTTAEIASKVPIPMWALFLCGALLGGGMLTTYAQRVTRAGVNMGSQFDHVALYAPGWCRAIARGILKMDPRRLRVLAPPPETTDTGKKIHFDALRAAVIMSVAASVIAYASGHGLPVSTTYVSFSAVIGSGIADRVFHRGDSDLKLGRFIWVVFGWLAAPAIAVVATGLIALLLFHLEIVGLAAALAVNIAARFVLKRTSDAHEKRHHGSGPMDDDDAPAPAPA